MIMPEQSVRYEDSQLYKIRHSAAHILAEAVLEMFPDAGIAIGPPIEDGFYYDFALPRPLTDEDLASLEKRMQEIIAKNVTFERKEVGADEARKVFANQKYKLELIDGLEKGGVDENGNKTADAPVISTYTQDGFTDLCRGPHVRSSKEINPKAIKLMSVAGAYWRGDSDREMLQRVYGTAFEKPAELEEHLRLLEEAKARDHRKLGVELGLFAFSPLVGKGLPLWKPKGATLRYELEKFLRTEQLNAGYLPVVTPHLGKLDLYETSGHYPYYKDSQYTPIDVDDERFLLRPMNCPHHIEIYRSEQRSYRDLPVRLAEFGTVYRYEASGQLNGLTRVRGFTVDDAHLFVLPEQLEDEFIGVVRLIQKVFGTVGLSDFRARVGTRAADNTKFVGSPELWDKATNAIISAAVLKRDWQLGTVQVDYNLPERFKLEYIGEDNQPHRPVMIHRAPFGSIERFVGILIEHFAGAFPVWLAPVQAMLIPVADRHIDYCNQVAAKLRALEMRVEVDGSNNRMNAKIREAQLQKIPYMLVAGDKDQAAGTVSVRLRSNEDLGAMPLENFVGLVQGVIASKSLELK
jgi:threonyl-tRNA synthetase